MQASNEAHRQPAINFQIARAYLHNFALDMNWLLAPLIPRRQWPKIQFRPKRAITLEEHNKILAGERNPQLLVYYQLLWHRAYAKKAHVRVPSLEDFAVGYLLFAAGGL